MQKNYNAKFGQSIYDVTLNAYGTLDNIIKLLQDSGNQGVDDVPISGQLYVYDDSLVSDQQVQQQYALSGIRYATLTGTNGTYYIINQDRPTPILPGNTGGDGPTTSPPMGYAVGQTQFVSNADGTTIITPVDADGASMIGYDIIAIEREIRPIENIPAPNQRWSWNKLTGVLTLQHGETLDAGVTLFILYSKNI